MTEPAPEAAPLPLRELINAAILAPSSHNTQPWRFRLAHARIDLYADRNRRLPVNDPDDRELTISCGAALLNLRVAAAWHGLHAEAALLPDAGLPDLLARVKLTRGGASGADAALHAAIPHRHTVRQPFSDTPVVPAALAELVDAAGTEGARLDVLGDEARRRAAALLVVEGDTTQWSDPGWRHELAGWMHSPRSGDGLAVPTLAAPAARLAVRALDLGDRAAARDRALAEHSPVLAVLGTDGDTPLDWLRAGMALQRLLLVAVGHGLQASYLNQPVEVAALCTRLQRMLGRPGYPQVFLRLGIPTAAADAAPRRPIDDVLLPD
jgi:nitroreductase